MDRPIRAVVADDEPNLKEYLCSALIEQWPELAIVGRASNGREALDQINELSPDIAFLDIKMPGLTGLEVAERSPKGTRIVFVTAFDEFAVDAFENAAVDYLLKPVEKDRLARTITRLKESSGEGDLAALFAALTDLKGKSQDYLGWIRVGVQGETRIVPVNEVIYFQADQKYTTVRSENGEQLIRTSIKELESRLDPERFWRIHRSTLVNVAFIEAARRDLRGRFLLHMRGLRQPLKVSDSYSHLFRQM